MSITGSQAQRKVEAECEEEYEVDYSDADMMIDPEDGEQN